MWVKRMLIDTLDRAQ